MDLSNATIESKFFFQFVFCAVSLAIVWGTTLERIKFSVYVIYAIVFSAIIYPIGAHWVFGGGFLADWLGTASRHAGLRGFDRRPPDRCDGRAWPRCCCSARGKGKYGPTASRGRSRGTACRCSAWAC